MLDNFSAYSQYYDLLYQDKNYEAEALYIKSLLQRFGSEVQTVLEHGAGTGRHAELLAQSGLSVTAVELSDTMRAVALARADNTSRTLGPGRFCVEAGDIRSLSLGREFDAVISLFHVMSYQTSDQDLSETLSRVAEHLKPGGLFVFDVWYGPAVLAIMPSVRIKRAENDAARLIRIAEPELHAGRNVVDVNYTIHVEDKRTGKISSISEIHPMRYFFMPEIRQLLQQHGMELTHSEEWLSGKDAGLDTWGVCFVAVRTSHKIASARPT